MPARPGTVLALAAILLGSCTSTDGADLRIAYLRSRMQGDVGLGPSNGADPGQRADVADDLGLGDANDSVLLAGVLPTGFGRFGASTFWFDKSGQDTLSGGFGDLAAGTAVRTETSFRNFKAFWAYDLLRTEHFRVAPGVALQILDIDLEAQSLAASAGRESVELFAPVPMLYVDADARFGDLVIAAQGGGMSIELEDGAGTYWDFEGRIGFVPREDLEFFAGYRFLSIDADGEAGSREADIDLRVDGWFLGGAYRF
jgi:hypothetical protein